MTALDSIKHYISFLQTGFVSLNPRNGQVLAWIGGINHQFFKYDHVLSKRQAGSVFKPMVYLKALENDVNPCDYYANDSIVYEDFENWTPANADKQFGGVYSVQGALINSVNTIAVKLLMEAGIDSVIHLAKEMGIESDMPEVPSLGLGTAQVSVLEIALAYSILTNEGRKVQPNFLLRIEDKNGNVIKRFGNDQKGKRVITEEIREKMTMMLQGVAERGTARSISKNYSIPGDVAGKTGTTQNHSDGWFVGYTPNLVFASWVGADFPGIHFQSLRYGQGAYTALPISAKFLVNLSNDSNSKEYFGRFAYNSINPSDYNCEDYREKAPGFIEKIFDKEIFQKESGKKKDKKGILKKIIGLFKKDKKDTIHAE
jgi:penicillin-binding protein 1A